MPFQKGHKLSGNRKGIPNKATANAKEAISQFVNGNADKLQGWLDQIAESDGPKAAAALYIDMVEYAVPKLARTELTGKDGEALVVKIDDADGVL